MLRGRPSTQGRVETHGLVLERQIQMAARMSHAAVSEVRLELLLERTSYSLGLLGFKLSVLHRLRLHKVPWLAVLAT